MRASNNTTFNCPECGFTKRVIHFGSDPKTPICDKCQIRMEKQ